MKEEKYPLADDKKVVKVGKILCEQDEDKNVDERFMCACPFFNARWTNQEQALRGRGNWWTWENVYPDYDCLFAACT